MDKRKFQIYYRKNPTFRLDNELTRDQVFNNGTHTFVKELMLPDVESAYREMQGEIWSPNGEMNSFIQKLGLHHTSMSIGDCAYDVQGDVMWQLNSLGWKEVLN